MQMNNSINNDLQDEYVDDNSIKKNEDANEKEVDDSKEQLSVDTESDDRSNYEEEDNYYEKLMAYMRQQEAKKNEQQNENKVNVSIDEEKPQVNYREDGSQPNDIEEPRKSLQQTK